jgi:hypothetical protein
MNRTTEKNDKAGQEFKTISQKKEEFDRIVRNYLESNPVVTMNRKTNELEIRFGTNTKLANPISKIDYDNVVKRLYACGFKTDYPNGTQILRIQNEYTDAKTGQLKMSNIRAEIVGTDLIQEYCRTNSLQKLIDMPSTTYKKLKFTQKLSALDKSGVIIKRLDMDDFNFRVSYQTEQDFNIQSPIARSIVSKWMDSKKMFRCMNRTRFYHPELPIFADISIVKTSKKTNKVPIPQYTIQEAGVFTNTEHYEIELEVDNRRVGTGTNYSSTSQLMTALRKSIRTVLSGLQGSKFPISYMERDVVLQNYIQLIRGKPEQDKLEDNPEDETDKDVDDKKEKGTDKPERRNRRILPKDFIGPGSYTLQTENILEQTENSMIPNIRNNYTVTEKADGERKLLYIMEDGKIYLIDTNMNVIFTGTRTSEKTIFDSLLDGEHIKYDKTGKYINLYMAFDIYYVNRKSVREFIFEDSTQQEEPETKQRLPLLRELISLIKPISVLEEKGEVEKKDPTNIADFRIACKNFYSDESIFKACSNVLSKIKDSSYEYNTDGLIFTPSNLAAGGTKVGGPPGPLYKSTWEYSFKWKPAEFNTIDFLVSIKKDKTGKDELHHLFQEGRNLEGIQDVIQYKTLVLMCGFDERKHGFINPCQEILNDNLPIFNDIDNEEKYKPMPFQPTDPYDPNACFTNIYLKEEGSNLFMKTEEGEYFEENMIVEFKYVDSNDDGWKWVPLRVRYDKTAELNAGQKNYGNAYHVANNNWHSIHHPITDRMLSTGNSIPEYTLSDDVYYNRSTDETSTRALRDFHNLYVKKNLIIAVANRGDTLIDYAVGKAGDMSKWIKSKLSFVFGVDISRDNIHNQSDGACTRFLKARRKYPEMPLALFVVGNSGLNIRNGQAFSTEKDKQITNSVFGIGPKDVDLLGRGVYNQYGVANTGFQISSCQFAMHYFFENKTTFHQFLRNLAECTKVGGYYIGTCYDGKTVFDLLKSKQLGESVTIMKNDRKIYEITKQYDQTGFPSEEMSLGYAIDVYQESINKVFREYLVNFEYFTRIMEDYGFILVSKEEARNMHMPNGSALFSELFSHMENEVKFKPKLKDEYGTAMLMSPEERRISFMNRYFIFRKVRNVDVKKMAEVILKQTAMLDRLGEENVAEMENELDKLKEMGLNQEEVQPTIAPRKLKRKLTLKKYEPIQEEKEVEKEQAIPQPVISEAEPIEVSEFKIIGEPMKLKVKRAIRKL